MIFYISLYKFMDTINNGPDYQNFTQRNKENKHMYNIQNGKLY